MLYGKNQSIARDGGILKQLQHPKTIPFRELDMLFFADDSFSRQQAVLPDEGSQTGMFKRRRTEKHRFPFGWNPERYPFVILHRWPWQANQYDTHRPCRGSQLSALEEEVRRHTKKLG